MRSSEALKAHRKPIPFTRCLSVSGGEAGQPRKGPRHARYAGRPMYFLACEWGVDAPWQWMRRYANAWRATGDHFDNWGSTAGVIEQMAGVASYGGCKDDGLGCGWNYAECATSPRAAPSRPPRPPLVACVCPHYWLRGALRRNCRACVGCVCGESPSRLGPLRRAPRPCLVSCAASS